MSHFDTVKSLANASAANTGKGYFMTLLGASHTTITDATIISAQLAGFFGSTAFNATISAQDALNQYVTVSQEFINKIAGNSADMTILNSPAAFGEFGVVTNQSALDATPQTVKRVWEIHVS
jgi:hypothetical protein